MDNLEKALLDAFNGVIFVDDSLVVERRASKVYARSPGIDARVSSTGRLGIHTSREQADLLRAILKEIEGD